MTNLKYFPFTLFLFLIGDSLWFLAAGNFFKEQIGTIARLSNGNFAPRLLPAIFVYIFMALAVHYFVFEIQTPPKLTDALIRGSFLGLFIYGVFDLTNRALLESYPLKMVVVDMSWGVFIFTLVSGLTFLIRQRF